MAFEGLYVFWKQIFLGFYAMVTAVRGFLMLFRPRIVLGWMRKTIKRIVEWCFRLVGRTMPRMKHEHQVIVVRLMGILSLLGASALMWWLVRHWSR